MKAISNIINTVLAKVVTAFAQVMVKFQPIWDQYQFLITLGGGFLIGLIIGWFLLGYGLFPVQWSNASPAHMRADFRAYYLSDVAEDYRMTGDTRAAYLRLFGQDDDYKLARDWPWVRDEDTLNTHIEDAIIASRSQALNPGGHHIDAEALEILRANLPNIIREVREAPLTPVDGEPVTRGTSVFLIVFVLALLALGIGAVVWFMFGPGKKATPDTGKAVTSARPGAAPGDVGLVDVGEPPVKSFNTPYVLGDDYFDPSFSIEVGPDFLGECGVGISETLGAGDPKKVTAFEAWLFDKSDIRTITTVMASEYAYNDPDLRAKLEPKGDLVELKPGLEVMLETTALRVKVTITDMEYAQGNLPPNSFLQKVTFELEAWVKETEGAAPDIEYPDFDVS